MAIKFACIKDNDTCSMQCYSIVKKKTYYLQEKDGADGVH